MCGLAGVFEPEGRGAAATRAARMVGRIPHRGPDDSGTYDAPAISLCHVRLSILDLSDLAAQPMASHDGRYVIAYNGEIYNFAELRRELEGAGRRTISTGDTEVLVEYLACFGVEATLPRLEGDWAFALWDTREEELVLARDRHGVKPLYYRCGAGGTVEFASELKAFQDLEADLVGVSALLLGIAGTWGDRTPFRDVRAVCPGEVVTFRGGETTRRTYAALTDFVDPALYEQLRSADDERVVDLVGEEFMRSIELRMVSDAPLACLVSGGVDSSLIACMAARVNPALGLYHANVVADSETPAATELARSLGLDLRQVRVTDRDFLDAVPAVTFHNDIPLIYHLNSVPFFLVSQLAGADGIKVLLTGEGSDEYFVGYPQYALAPVLGAVDAAKGLARGAFHRATPKLARLLWPDPAGEYTALLRDLQFRYEPGLVKRWSEDALRSVTSAADKRLQVMTLELAQEHLVSLLHRNDRLGMAWGLESRFPFLGHGVARLAVNLPARHKLRRSLRVHDTRHPFVVDKWVVREVARRFVPEALAQRRKEGFPVSVYRRLDVSSDLFRDGFVADAYGLGRAALDEMLRSPREWLVRLMLVEVWGRMLIGGASVEETQKLLARHVDLAAA